MRNHRPFVVFRPGPSTGLSDPCQSPISNKVTGEKRDAERVHIPGVVTGEVTVYEPMSILDLSDRGAQVETKFALQLGSLHDFRLSLGNRSVIVKGRIVHCQIGELREGVSPLSHRRGVRRAVRARAPGDSRVRGSREERRECPPRLVEAEIADDRTCRPSLRPAALRRPWTQPSDEALGRSLAVACRTRPIADPARRPRPI